MPPAVLAAAIPAAIGGVSSLIGGHQQAKANERATDAQLQANREALAYQKVQDRLARAQAAQMWDDYNKRRGILFQRYGLPMPEFTNPYSMDLGGMPGAQPRAGVVPRPMMGMARPMPPAPGMDMGEPGMPAGVPVGAAPAEAALTLSEIMQRKPYLMNRMV